MFLQDTVDTFSNTIQAMQQEVPQQELSLFELLSKGGWVMIPLTLLALLGLIIFFERYLTIKKPLKTKVN